MYLDPGFGSMVIQVAIGLVAAGGVAFYTFRQRIAKLFGRSATEDEQEAESNKDE
jgi:hypothetical protein